MRDTDVMHATPRRHGDLAGGGASDNGYSTTDLLVDAIPIEGAMVRGAEMRGRVRISMSFRTQG